MAYRPSFRRHREEESTELNLTPVMNLMVVMIPLLLTSAVFIKIGIIELNLPPSVGAGGIAGSRPKEVTRTLDLTVSITDRGFYVSSAVAGLQKPAGAGPTIPVRAEGGYDFDALSLQLYEIKKQAGETFSDSESIVIQAENNVRYQTLVSTMDAARKIVMDGRVVTLFPQVSLSAGVI